MRKEDETWLLSSISSAWKCVRVDAGKGWVWTERDIATSFCRHLIPLLQSRNAERANDTGEFRVLTELNIYRTSNKWKPLDIVIAYTDRSCVPEPNEILAHFEMKCKIDYGGEYVKTHEMKDAFPRLLEFDERWNIWGIAERSYNPSFIIVGLIASDWDNCLYRAPSDPKGNGILHPNGKNGSPRLNDFNDRIRYFELHGPFSVYESSQDYILKENKSWGFYEVGRNGTKREII